MTNKEAIDIINNRLNTYYCTDKDLQALDLAIKALEERPTGKWIFDGVCFSTTKFKCSICHLPELEKTNYCPNCGAKMKGGRE